MLTDGKLQALVRLLDDTDPEVLSQVEQEFFTLGESVVPRLVEISRQMADQTLQERVNDLIGRIQLQHFSDELLRWRQAGGPDLLDAWIMVSQVAEPSLNPQKHRDAISRLVNRTWLMMRPGMTDIEKMCVINKMFYGTEGFNGNFLKPELPENNLIGYVLEHKTGNHLSLSLLYTIIAQQLGITLQVVNFQGYHALRYYSRDQHFYLDAYNKGLFFNPQQVSGFLGKMGADENVSHYKSLSNIYVILNLIESLSVSYDRAGNPGHAQRFLELAQNIEIRFDGGSQA
jgi:regulator of sirC expression with transglutaminase-like and TPR domain